jgi:TctA family transporter
VGVYSVNSSMFDVILTAGFGLVGYVFARLDCEPAPLLLGFVLGPMMEENFRRTLLMSRGDFSVFVSRPISATLLVVAVVLITIVLLPSIRVKREQAFYDEAG